MIGVVVSALLGTMLAICLAVVVRRAMRRWAAADFDAFRASHPNKCRWCLLSEYGASIGAVSPVPADHACANRATVTP